MAVQEPAPAAPPSAAPAAPPSAAPAAPPSAALAAPPSAEVVGNAFVDQYYHILHQSPEMVHRFYQDSSLLSRPDANGLMTKVTTMRAINEKILSLNYKDYTVEIKTADAQESHERGVIVLVTGCLTGKDNARRKFTQTFFLAPQDGGYFVLNDVFRYVGESESLANGTNENAPAVALTPELGAIDAPDQLAAEPAAAIEEEDLDDVAEVCDPSDNEGSVLEEETIESPVHKAAESTPAAEEDAPKTYASILKDMQGNAPSRSVYVPSSRAAGGAPSTVQQSTGSVSAKPSAPVTTAPVSDNAPESSNHNEEVEGHSIYIRNLPYNATVELLEEEFRKFGPIKPNGIQVRSAKGSCFGFVEFEALSSMQSALQASPIAIGGHQAVVEEKRTTTRVSGNSGGSRGRYSSRGGYRSDSFRGRGNYGGGRGYGRNEFRTQGEYSGRPRGSAGRGGETYQRVNPNGLGRGGRQGGGNHSSVPPST